MTDFLSTPSTAFQGTSRIAAGRLADVALAVRAVALENPNVSCLTFSDATGRVIDLDLRGTAEEIVARLGLRGEPPENPAPKTRGRPKLGVVAREVTLLPRHWDWLARQPGGASQALRRLVDGARRTDLGQSEARAAQAVAYAFLSAVAGNFPGFEEATRALFAADEAAFIRHMHDWPEDIRSHALMLMKNRPDETEA